MNITMERIVEKLGFDPMNPPEFKQEPDVVDDRSPSLWEPLTREEKAFLIKKMTGMQMPVGEADNS